MIKYVKGDLIEMALEGHFDVIMHGCNCFCTMGAGVAKSIKEVFPEAYSADLFTVKGDIEKLGFYSEARVKTLDDKELIILNCYTQYNYGRFINSPFDINAFRDILFRVKSIYKGKRIGMPKIGSGLGGGDWNEIEKAINEALDDFDVTIVNYQRNSNINLNLNN